jgi:predicted neuraminidase
LDSAKVGAVVAMLVKRDIFAPMESHPMAHAATLTVLPDGDLLCAFYAGTYETAPDQAIFLAHGHRQGNEWMWTKPHKLVDTNGKADGNPVLFVAPDEAVWLFFVTLQGRGWVTALLFAMRSTDGGMTWGEPQLLCALQGIMPRTKPLVLRDGAWLLPLYDERRWQPVFWRSEDGGRSWREVATVQRRGLIQPAVVELSDGRLLAYCRSTIRCIVRLTSDDGGVTWSTPEPTDLPNPNAAIDLARMSDGALVLAFNDNAERRTPLSIAFSPDESERWTVIRDLEVGDGEFSYPCLVADGNGLVHCVYTYRRQTIRHAVFDRHWLKGGM